MSKLCNQCAITKPKTDFYPCGDYFQAYCKPCHNKRRNTYYVKKGYKPRVDKKIVDDIGVKLRNGGKLKELSKEYNIKYTTVFYWATSGKFDTETYKYKKKTYKQRKTQ